MVSTATVSHYVQGIHFPANKSDLVNIARQHNAPNEVIETLNNLPENSFGSMADLWHGIGEVE